MSDSPFDDHAAPGLRHGAPLAVSVEIDNEPRTPLVIDMESRLLRAGMHSARLPRRVAADLFGHPTPLLRRYLRLVHQMRGTRRGAAPPMRADDLSTLTEILALENWEVARVVAELERRAEWPQRVLQRRVLVPVAGVAVVATAWQVNDAAAPSSEGGVAMVLIDGSLHPIDAAPSTLRPGLGVVVVPPSIATPTSTVRRENGPGTPSLTTTTMTTTAPIRPTSPTAPTSLPSLTIPILPAVPEGTGVVEPYHLRAGRAALGLVSYPWQEKLPGWEVRFLEEEPGFYGSTFPREKRIEVYVRDTQSVEHVAHILAHELGHAVDVTFNSDADRRLWRETRGLRADSEWWMCCALSDFSVASGDFAEAFAAWQTGPDYYRSALADPPDAREVALLRELATG